MEEDIKGLEAVNNRKRSRRRSKKEHSIAVVPNVRSSLSFFLCIFCVCVFLSCCRWLVVFGRYLIVKVQLLVLTELFLLDLHKVEQQQYMQGNSTHRTQT